MIQHCCYYCKKFIEDTCKKPICYNAYAHPSDIKEGNWYCQQYEGSECGETVANDDSMAEANKECWEKR